MKKITFLLCLLVVSLGYAQDNLEDFEGAAPTINFFDGADTANIVADPAMGGTNGQVLELITNTAGQPWQGTEMLFQGDFVDLSTANKTMTVDVYSTTATSILAKVDGPQDMGAASAADANHGGTGWETLSFDFNAPKDGTPAASDVYSKIVFFPAWNNEGGTCTTGCYAGGAQNDTPAITIYLDNISGLAAAPAETCNDGILNNGETEIDCGGPNCDACDPLPGGPAPDPTTPNNQVLSIYGDTGGYTSIWTPDYSFGATQGEVDLGSGSTNNAIKMDFSDQGYGQGTNDPVDISEYEWVHFDYYAPNIAAGANGHEVKFILIGAGEGEKDYILKTDGSGDGMLVFDAWQSVDVPLSHFTNLGLTLPNYLQYKLGTTSDLNTTVVYFDNIYIWSNEALSTDDIAITDFKVYPNPTNGDWNFESNAMIRTITVYDILGKQVSSLSPNSNDAKISTADIKSGVYFAKIESDNGSKSVKLIKE